MSSPPSFLSVELEEQDVHASMVHIVESMNLLRKEELKEDSVKDEVRDHYLHLTYRLASTLEGLIDDHSSSKMQEVAGCLRANPALLHYDVFQDTFWATVEPEFSTNLDELVISFMGDDFSGLKDKHHFFNAIKYLDSQDDSLTERLQVYDTLLPFHPPKTEKMEKSWKRLKKFCKVNGTKEKSMNLYASKVTDLDSLLRHASYMGFQEVYVSMAKKVFDKAVHPKYPRAEIVTMLPSELGNAPAKNRAEKLRFAIAYTGIVSLPLVSGLPTDLLKRLDTYFEENGARKVASEFSWYLGVGTGLEGVYSAAAGIYALATYPGSQNILPTDTLSAMVISGFLTLSFLSRLAVSCFRWSSTKEYHESDIRGNYALSSMPLAGVVYAYDYLAKMFRKKKKMNLVKYANEMAQVVRIPVVAKFPLKGGMPEEGEASNYHAMLERLAAYDLPDDVVNNLTWKIDNHHRQGKFVEEQYQKSELYEPSFQQKRVLNREENALVSYDSFHSGPYTKLSALITFADMRYAITAVGCGDEVEMLKTATDWLAHHNLDSNKEKEAFGKTMNAHHLHLSCFKNKEKIHDFTVTS